MNRIGPRFDFVRNGVKRSLRRPAPEFADIVLEQEIDECQGPIRCAKFSNCGQLMATGGADCRIRLYCSQKVWRHFAEHRSAGIINDEVMSSCGQRNLAYSAEYSMLLLFSVYEGHTDEVLDLTWSRHNFLLSVSLDKTVRLWHVSQVDCLCIFRHEDYVSTARFMPHDDRFFATCCFDGNVRVWSIPEKKIIFCRNVSRERDNRRTDCSQNIITCACFTNGGMILVLGTADGRLLFYNTDRLQYITQCHVCVASLHNPKVIAIENVGDDKRQLLITCDDSRVRLFNSYFWTFHSALEFKGATIKNAPTRASISPDSKFVVCGSEDNCIYVWRSNHNSNSNSKSSLWERLNHKRTYECIRLDFAEISVECGFVTDSSSSSTSSNFEENFEILDDDSVADEENFEHLAIDTESEFVCDETDSSLNETDTSDTSDSPKSVWATSAFFAPDPTVFHSLAKYVLVSIDHAGHIRVFTKPHYLT